MELYLIREQFQSDMDLVRRSKSVSNAFLFCLQKDDNLQLWLVSNSKIVEIGRMQPLCCTVIFVICGVNTEYKCDTKLLRFLVCFLLAASYIQNAYNCANIDIVLKYLSYCNYSKTYRYTLFQR